MKSAVKHNFKTVSFCTVHRDECKKVKKNKRCDADCESCGRSEEVYQHRYL